MHKLLTIAALVMLWPASAGAEEDPSAERWSFAAGFVLAFERGGQEGHRAVDDDLGGLRPGGALAIVRRRRPGSGIAVGLEAEATLFYETVQSGTSVRGPRACSTCGGQSLGRHRDTMLSLLVGGERGPLMLRIGPSLVLRDTFSNGQRIEGFGETALGLTAALDVGLRVNDRIDIVPGARYSFVRLPHESSGPYMLGVGPHVLRAALGMRIRLSTH